MNAFDEMSTFFSKFQLFARVEKKFLYASSINPCRQAVKLHHHPALHQGLPGSSSILGEICQVKSPCPQQARLTQYSPFGDLHRHPHSANQMEEEWSSDRYLAPRITAPAVAASSHFES